MTSIDMSFSPVKSGNLAEELDTIFTEDMEYAYSRLKDCGLISLTVGMTAVAVLSGLKLVTHSINYMKKPTGRVDVIEINRETVANHKKYHGDEINPIITMRESLNRNKDYYQPDNRIKSEKAEAINDLRKYLYAHNLTLQGYVLKIINHKLSHKDLVKLSTNESIGHTFTTTHITFGNTLNKLLSLALPSRVQLKKKKLSDETYLIAENDDYGYLQEHLRNLYQEPIKVQFDYT
jgi:hypothetical protein